MNTLRELVLIVSTFTWIGAGIWIMVSLIAADPAISGAEAAEMAPRASYFVCAAGIVIFTLTSFVWKKKKRTD